MKVVIETESGSTFTIDEADGPMTEPKLQVTRDGQPTELTRLADGKPHPLEEARFTSGTGARLVLVKAEGNGLTFTSPVKTIRVVA